MNGDRRNVATKKPVTAPQAQPTAMAASSASRNFISACSIIMKIQAESAMTEPNEISSWPTSRMNVKPSATMP